VAEHVVAPNALQWDRAGQWPEPAIRALQDEGLAGLVVARQHGGHGGGLAALLRLCEVIGERDASTGLCFGMHCVATACIAAKATDEQVERLLRPIAQGKHWTTLALSEPGTGSHFYLPQTTMEPGPDGYTLNGTKAFVTNGGHADSYVVSTVPSDAASAGHFSMVLVPAESLEGAWGKPWTGWGMRANSSRDVMLRDVKVALNNRLGAEGDQLWYVFHVVAPHFLMAMAGTYLGVASRAFHLARTHLTRRSYAHTGQSLSEVQVLQHRVGELWARLQRVRQLCYWAAEEADGGGPDALPALCCAKAEVGGAAVDIVNDCMTLLGGAGYREDAEISKLLRDARAAHVMSPTTDILYTWAGRALLDLPILGR
jgi:alkylation response protein AidB-like acyl-CoA dehydrogenase